MGIRGKGTRGRQTEQRENYEADGRATQRRVKPFGLLLPFLGLTLVELKFKFREFV